MLQHVVDRAAEAAVGDVVVVLGAHVDAIRAALTLPACARTMLNDRFADGPSSSLRTGLDALPDAVARATVILGDQPGIEPSVIARVTRHTGDIVRAVYDGTPGHPIAFGRAVWPLLRAEVGDRGARAVVARHPEHVTDIQIPGPPPRDIDTEADYEAIRERWYPPTSGR